MTDSALAVEILKNIRDEVRGVWTEARGTNERLDVTNQRLEAVELTLLELAEQQRFVVRYTKALSERDSRLEGRVENLELRVVKLESR